MDRNRPPSAEVSPQNPTETARGFSVWRLVLGLLALLLAISGSAQWYGRNVTMPRYCQYPTQAVQHVDALLTTARPAGEGDRKPYIIAARLTFLLPRESDEALPQYLERLRAHIARTCAAAR